MRQIHLMLINSSMAISIYHHLSIYESVYTSTVMYSLETVYAQATIHGNQRITPSNATNAMAFAGNALRKQGTNPRQYPLQPRS